MRQRILTSMIFLPIVFGGLALGGGVWAGLTEMVVFFDLLEFFALSRGKPYHPIPWVGVLGGLLIVGAVAFQWLDVALFGVVATFVIVFILETIREPHAPRQNLMKGGFLLVAFAYIALPASVIIDLRLHRADGLFWILVILAVTVGTDTFAYFGGRLFGKRKLAPILSPNKTIEGAVIGAVCGFGLALLFLAVRQQLYLTTILMIMVSPIIAILGDLFESALKRYFQVKDSHLSHLNIMPGHGGVLDRTDSLLFTAPFVYFWLLLSGLIPNVVG